jgi:hypothetical protein
MSHYGSATTYPTIGRIKMPTQIKPRRILPKNFVAALPPGFVSRESRFSATTRNSDTPFQSRNKMTAMPGIASHVPTPVRANVSPKPAFLENPGYLNGCVHHLIWKCNRTPSNAYMMTKSENKNAILLNEPVCRSCTRAQNLSHPVGVRGITGLPAQAGEQGTLQGPGWHVFMQGFSSPCGQALARSQVSRHAFGLSFDKGPRRPKECF